MFSEVPMPVPDGERRRSPRIPLPVPLFGISLDPSVKFFRRLTTLEVSSHGCLVRARRPFPRQTPLRLNILLTGRSITARVVRSDPVAPDVKSWNIALEFDSSGEVWTVPSPKKADL